MKMIEIDVPLERLQQDWARVYDSGQYTEALFRSAFESAVESMHHMHAIAVSSAGAGLFALHSVLRNGKPWAVPNNTFFATGAMPLEAGSRVVLVDASIDDFSMSYDALRQVHNLTPDLGGVTLTHVGGGLAKDYPEIAAYCQDHNLTLIEDAAHAFGVNAKSIVAGCLSKAAVFSFYPTKAVPAGEGGCIVTYDADLARELRQFINYGKHTVDGVIKYGRGFNLRMDEWTAVVAYHQTLLIDEIIERRTEAAARLEKLFGPSLLHPLEGASNFYKYPVKPGPYRLKTGRIYTSTDQLRSALSGAYLGTYGVPVPLANSTWIADNHDCLPVGNFTGMRDDELLAEIMGVPAQ